MLLFEGGNFDELNKVLINLQKTGDVDKFGIANKKYHAAVLKFLDC